MAKIHILDSSIYNRIAAGEVVDRPYSVVKEFVENSLDAGAKNISVSIERGGKDLICVSDDGCGIERSEMKSAFLPHATSKIACVEDLDLIRTLGFRGEALASIAAVSNVRLCSKAAGCDNGYEIVCSGGKIGELSPCAIAAGTEITAENLFFNTPVRAKFLKTDKGEEGDVSNLISRFVLGNPSVAFKYYIEGKLALQSFGGGLEEAVAAVYGSAVISECYNIDASKHGVHIYGYIGKPSYTKANRTYQSTFVNGRYVNNNTIASAMSNAYASYLMKRQYPFYVLFIDVPPEVVDVNVHPNKSDVRFENNQVIYGCVYSVVSSLLDGNAAALEFVVQKDPVSLHEAETSSEKSQANTENLREEAGVPNVSAVAEKTVQKELGSCVGLYAVPLKDKSRFRLEFHDSKKNTDISEDSAEAFRTHQTEEGASPSFQEDIFSENKRYLEAMERKAKQQKIIFENAIYKGNLFNTYLIYEEGDNAYLIDQHAAHERLIFDRLKADMNVRKIVKQPMLVPFILNLNHEEFSFLAENLDKIEEIGFDMEQFGAGSFKVSAVPLDLQDIDLSGFFDEILKDVGALRGIKLSDLLRDKLAMAACKHAVKGGMVLTDSEKQKLFELLHGNMGLKCPHGRPIAVKLSKTEIEKMFKRIV